MADIKWIKITTTMFDDEKIKLIESMPDCDSILIIWIKLLAQAGKCNATGYLILTQNIPYTDEMLASIFNRPLNTVRMALSIFKDFGMIDMDDNCICISNWGKHQNVEGMEKVRELARDRKNAQRLREKQLKLMSRDSHVTVTQCHAIDIDIDIEKNNNICIPESENKPKKKPKTEMQIPYQEIMDLYNTHCVSLPKIKGFTVARESAIKSLLKEIPDFNFLEFFKSIEASDFLTGRVEKDPWKNCCFDWIIKPANRQKIIEGNYINKSKKQNKPDRYQEVSSDDIQ